MSCSIRKVFAFRDTEAGTLFTQHLQEMRVYPQHLLPMHQSMHDLSLNLLHRRGLLSMVTRIRLFIIFVHPLFFYAYQFIKCTYGAAY